MRSFLRVLFVVSVTFIAGCSGGGSGPSGYGGGGGGGGTPTPTPTPSPGATNSPAALVVPTSSIYLGAYANPNGGGSDANNIALFEAQVGRRMALSLHYNSWTTPFPGPNEAADAANGRVPVISWNCGITDAQVAAGNADTLIEARANDFHAYGKPVLLRYKWEMNRPATVNGRLACANPAHDLPGGFFSPTDFIAAWNHIHAIFVAAGATNVAFLWNPSAGNTAQNASYYPGDASVDWVGIDQYDRGDVAFANSYNMYAEVSGYKKPIVIAETGANPSYQPTFLGAAAQQLAQGFPEVKGFVYFDAPGNASWTLTPAGISAFATLGQNAYMKALSP